MNPINIIVGCAFSISAGMCFNEAFNLPYLGYGVTLILISLGFWFDAGIKAIIKDRGGRR